MTTNVATAIKHSVSDRVEPSFVIFDIWALWQSVLSIRVPRCQKISNDGLTQSGTGCFYLSHMATVGVIGLSICDVKILTKALAAFKRLGDNSERRAVSQRKLDLPAVLYHLVRWRECHCSTGRPGRLIIRSQWCDEPSAVSVPPTFTAPRHRLPSASSTTDSTRHVDVMRSRDLSSNWNSSLKRGLDVLGWVVVLLLASFSPAHSNHTRTNAPAQPTNQRAARFLDRFRTKYTAASQNYTVSQKRAQLWNGIALNCNDRFWWYLAKIFKSL